MTKHKLNIFLKTSKVRRFHNKDRPFPQIEFVEGRERGCWIHKNGRLEDSSFSLQQILFYTERGSVIEVL